MYIDVEQIRFYCKLFMLVLYSRAQTNTAAELGIDGER